MIPRFWLRSTLLAVMLVGASSCAKTAGDRVCAPGAVQHCPCLAGPDGVQTCADDGSRWGPCACVEADGGPGREADRDGAAPTNADLTGEPTEDAAAEGMGVDATAAETSPDVANGPHGRSPATGGQVGDTRRRIEDTLTLENIVGGGTGGPVMGTSEQFGGASAAVTGLQDALAVAVGTASAPPAAGPTPSTPSVVVVTPVPASPTPQAATTAAPPRRRVQTSGGTAAGGSGRMGADTFRTTFGRKRTAIEQCYDEALAHDPALAGGLTFIIVISQVGSVGVEVERDNHALSAAGVTECIAGKLRTMGFASSPPTGGDFRVQLPMTLTPE